jgi:hypothetical protein
MITTEARRPLDAMPEVLRWSNGEATLNEVHDAYVQQVSDALGAHLRALRGRAADVGARLEAAVQRSSNDALARVLLAPETVSRLLFPISGELSSTSQFLEAALAAEAALAGLSSANGRVLWTALGDARVLPSGEVIRAPCVAGRIPLDLDSPHGCMGDVTYCDSRNARHTLTVEDRLVAFDRLRAAYEIVTGAGLAGFVSTFTKVLVLRKEEPGGFSSGSETRYIGRSVLGNPHSPIIDYLDIAEATVHEAIHSLLYMQERRHPWVPAELYAPEPRVVSPWSGRNLALRPFLQACFVWYGILQFWGKATTTGILSPAQLGERIARAATGFLGLPILQRLSGEDYKAVDPSVLRAITNMQSVVQDAFT